MKTTENEIQNPIRKKFSLAKKLFILATILFLSSIPRWLAELSVLSGRMQYHEEAVRSVTSGWAAPHQGIGKIEVIIPALFERAEVKKNEAKTYRYDARTYRPTTRNIQVEVKHETRKRGIFEIPIYTSEVEMKAHFNLAEALKSYSAINGNGQTGRVSPILNEITFSIPLTYSYALSDFSVEVNGKKIEATRSREAITAYLKDFIKSPADGKLDFVVRQTLKGYDSLSFDVPGGKTQLNVKSSWQTPSFQGQLPQNYTLNKSGFDAGWSLYDPIEGQEIRIEFYEAVNLYRQTERAFKYGFLVSLVCLTLFFLFEVLQGLRLHEMHYLLLSLPISIFFILLIALSEQVGFGPAYGIASVAVLALMASYLKGIGAKSKQYLTFTMVGAAEYGIIYVLLLSSDYALLLGSITLFILLAVVMKATQRVNWQELGST